MKHSYSYTSKRIMLLPLEENDIELLRVLRNQESKYFLSQNEISAEAQKVWYERYLEKDDDIMFKVVKKDSPKEFIGAIAIYDIDWEKKTCECGRTVIDKNNAPEKGIGMEATTAVCAFAFDELKLTKVVGEVLKDNERIIVVDTRAGFKIVGEGENIYYIEMTPESINRGNIE